MAFEGLIAAGLSLGLQLITAVLTAAKMWPRRHVRRVAESVSPTAESIAVVSSACLLVVFLWHLSNDPSFAVPAAREAITLVLSSMFLLVAMKLFVGAPARRPHTARQIAVRYLQSLAEEAREAARRFRREDDAAVRAGLMRILYRIACLDGAVNAREDAVLSRHARALGVPLDAIRMPVMGSSEFAGFRLRGLIRELSAFVDRRPPRHLVRRLRRAIGDLAGASGGGREAAAALAEELVAALDAAVTGASPTDRHEVLLVPHDHDDAVHLAALAGTSPERRAGGTVVPVGCFATEAAAQLVCRQYRELGLLTFVEYPSVID